MMVAPIACKHYLWVQIPPGCPPLMGLFSFLPERAIVFARKGHLLAEPIIFADVSNIWWHNLLYKGIRP